MIELSIAIPMFRSKYIGWLVLESLKNQREINFEWELIVVEEQNDETFGIGNVMAYKETLHNIGCKRIKYVPLQDWIPLSKKFRLHMLHISNTSKIITQGAADAYLPPLRLNRIYRAFNEHPKIDWFRGYKVIFYDIAGGNTFMICLVPKVLKGLYKAVRVKYAPKVEKGVDERSRLIDGWYFNMCNDRCHALNKRYMKIFNDDSTDWKYGFTTHGFHNITLNRDFSKDPFMKNPIDLIETIPAYIMKKLKGTEKFLSKHKFSGLP